MGAAIKVTATETMGSLPPSVLVNDRIVLTDKENQIFNLLLQVSGHFNLNTEVRVAGSWVRDKLLGKECYDIDIALENMVGKEFCDKVNEYLSASGEETKGIGLIQRFRLQDTFLALLKLKSSDAETVISLHQEAEKFLSLIPLILSNKNLQILKVEWKKEIIDVPVMAKLKEY